MTTIDNMKNKFEEMPWDNNDESLKKIKSGQKSLKCGNLAKKACNDVTRTTIMIMMKKHLFITKMIMIQMTKFLTKMKVTIMTKVSTKFKAGRNP